MSTMATEGRTIVRSADRMDTETFCLHMTMRHSDSLGGMPELSPEHLTSYVEECWRAFHRRLHEIRPDLDHDHGRP